MKTLCSSFIAITWRGFVCEMQLFPLPQLNLISVDDYLWFVSTHWSSHYELGRIVRVKYYLKCLRSYWAFSTKVCKMAAKCYGDLEKVHTRNICQWIYATCITRIVWKFSSWLDGIDGRSMAGEWTEVRHQKALFKWCFYYGHILKLLFEISKLISSITKMVSC